MKLIQADDIESVLRRYLARQGYSCSLKKQRGETGCDIRATQDGISHLFIEAIGFQQHAPIRSREFYECFFRVVSRDRGCKDDTLVMALPSRFIRGMPQRKRQYGVAWEKIGRAFPNLEIWYVDTENEVVERRSWLACDE